MILTCPECESRFTLSAEILAPEGKRVKCSSCGETWFQLPDPDELIEELESAQIDEPAFVDEPEEDVQEDIPEAVKPVLSESLDRVVEVEDDSPRRRRRRTNKTAVFFSGLLMFCVLASPLIAFKDMITKAWPESLAFYKVLGMGGPFPGEGVVFDQMHADFKGSHFVLTGQIINLTSHGSALPLIEVSLKNEHNKEIERHYIRMPKDILNAEEILPIRAEYEVKHPEQVKDVSVRFVLKPKGVAKIASKVDGSNQSPHADAKGHQNDGAKASKSPAHDGAQPHQESAHDSHKDHH
jgi:predicted Zn finger-like uncharacterized protein